MYPWCKNRRRGDVCILPIGTSFNCTIKDKNRLKCPYYEQEGKGLKEPIVLHEVLQVDWLKPEECPKVKSYPCGCGRNRCVMMLTDEEAGRLGYEVHTL